ncbi:MAG TPA: hypothetical protein VIF09_28170 [Polyangiaceae bacterium]|jgi:hypothetical protein
MDLEKAKVASKKFLKRLVIGLVLFAVVGTALYMLFTLNYTYSDGVRVGIVQKLSKKGWLCKTNEGELAVVTTGMGQQSPQFVFTVRDDKVVQDIDALSGHKVELHYEEHRGIPSSCFGDTQYFVTAVKKAD